MKSKAIIALLIVVILLQAITLVAVGTTYTALGCDTVAAYMMDYPDDYAMLTVEKVDTLGRLVCKYEPMR